MTTESRSKNQQLTSFYYDIYGRQSVSTDVDQVVCSESISGYRGPRLAGAVNPCSHTKVTVIPKYVDFGHMDAYGREAGFGFKGLFPFSAAPSWTYAYPSFSLSPEITPAEAKLLMAELTGDIPPVVSVPNMLLELPETLSLWHDLKKPLLSLFHDPGVRKKWRAGSNALLSQQFGLFPLIGDIQKLITSKKTVHSELRRLCAVPSRFTPGSRKLGRRAVKGSFNIANSQGYRVKQVDWNGEATLFYEYRKRKVLDCSDPTVISAMSSALYGWDRPLGTLWEATPFSFVADWFIPVGTYLQGLEKSIFSGSIEVRRLGWCAKGTCIASIENLGVGYATPAWQETHTVKCTQFLRGIGIPTSPLWDELTIPGVRQSILGAALLLQR